MSPQAKYNKEVRKCSLYKQLEAEKQKERRDTNQYRALNAAYQRLYRKQKNAPRIMAGCD